jgi:hypothetical protein
MAKSDDWELRAVALAAQLDKAADELRRLVEERSKSLQKEEEDDDERRDDERRPGP